MNKETIAVDYFKNGFNCAQAVLLSFKEQINIQEAELFKIACGFGAGIGMLQNTCGAVSGAYLVIGSQYGKYLKDDTEAGEKTYSLVRKFEAEFKQLHKTTNCKELLGCDLLTEDGKNYFNANNLKEKVCVKCVEDAVKLLNALL